MENVLLAGIVGSTAYGLAGPDSDVDRLGMFAAPTIAFHGLSRPEESVVRTKPDVTLHEAAKWLRLALKGNPSVLELAWLPDDLYEVRTELGNQLIGLRGRLLSRHAIRTAYFGYATQQFQRLHSRGDGSFSADTRKRTAKHARHLLRLLDQGVRLYQTGQLQVRLDDTERYHMFGRQVAAGNLDAARTALAKAEAALDDGPCALPEKPDVGASEEWLFGVRRVFLHVGAA